MKILFVCRANFARSQIAEAIFNKLSKQHKANSAGVAVEKEHLGQELGKSNNVVVLCMEEIGLDLTKKRPKAITQEMVQLADKVIMMVDKELWPDYLSESSKLIRWNIRDPKFTDLVSHRAIREEIKAKVQGLLKELTKDI